MSQPLLPSACNSTVTSPQRAAMAYWPTSSGSWVDVERHPVWALVNQRGAIDRAARQQQVAEHLAIVQAIRDGRADFAAEAVRAHLGQMERQVPPPPLIGLRDD